MKPGIYGQQLELFQLFQPVNLINCQTKFTFVDLFAGIGGFRIPLEELGGKCLGYSEIDKEAIKVYQNNFIKSANVDEVYLGDITKLGKLPFEIDVMVGGVPCQPWSIAGKLQGLDDPRGKLWLDVFRLVKANQPKAFIFENVKGLTEPRNKPSLQYIINNLTASGYVIKYQVLNSSDFGLPQDRDRIFIVGIKNDIENCWGFTFPKPVNTKLKLYDVVLGLQKANFIKKKFPTKVLFDRKIPASRGRFQKIDELNDFFLFADIRDGHTTIHSWDLIKTNTREKLICQTILKNRRKKIYGAKDGNPLSFKVLKTLIHDLQEEEIESLVTKEILRFVEGQGYEFVNSKISSGINGVSKIFLPHAEAERQKEYYESAVKKGQAKPSLEEMIAAVLNSRRSDDLDIKTVRADLYILTNEGTEFLFEIKSPKPNKGQCLEVTQRLLRLHLLRGEKPPKVQAYYAMPYNPYGVRKTDYKHSLALNYTPFKEAVVIGNEFWNIVGGATAYEELLEIYLEVGNDKSKYILDALAFGF